MTALQSLSPKSRFVTRLLLILFVILVAAFVCVPAMAADPGVNNDAGEAELRQSPSTITSLSQFAVHYGRTDVESIPAEIVGTVN